MLRKKSKWIFIICGVFLIMQYLICSNVYLMGGDDYMYGSFGHNGIFTSVFSYYFTGNGRWLINIIDSFQLIFDRYLYLIITPWLLLLLSFVIYRFICILFNKDNVYIFVASVGLISMIDIQIARETTYWITGAMNYLVPALFLMAGMSATLQLRKKDLPGKEAALYGVLCLLSCLTVEQYGLMSIGWMILIWGYDLIKSKKINKRNTLILLISLISLSTIIIAPGNYVRIDDAAEKGTPLITKVIDLIYYDYYSKASSTFLFVLAALCSIRFFRAKKKLFSILSALNALIILVCFVYNYVNAPFVIVILSIMLSLITLTPTLVSVFKQVGLISLLSLAVISFGSQMMLLVSQLWGFRTSMCLVLVYIVLILALLQDTIKADRPSNIYICIGCVVLNPYLGIIGIIASLFPFLTHFKRSWTFGFVLFLALIVVGLGDEVIGYHENSPIHKENIQTAKSAANNENISEITILSYNDEPYGWVSPPFSEWAETYFKKYYNIPDGVSIKYKEVEEE